MRLICCRNIALDKGRSRWQMVGAFGGRKFFFRFLEHLQLCSLNDESAVRRVIYPKAFFSVSFPLSLACLKPSNHVTNIRQIKAIQNNLAFNDIHGTIQRRSKHKMLFKPASKLGEIKTSHVWGLSRLSTSQNLSTIKIYRFSFLSPRFLYFFAPPSC